MTERPPSKNPWLRMSPLPRAIGIVLIVVGGVWVLQGIGVAQGSVMTGKTFWAVLGAAFLIAGGLVLRQATRTAKAAIAADPPSDAPSAAPPPPADPPVS